jgi:hypothetical protein
MLLYTKKEVDTWRITNKKLNGTKDEWKTKEKNDKMNLPLLNFWQNAML